MRIRFSAAEVGIVLAIACLAVVAYKLAPRQTADAGLVLDAPTGCDLNVSRCAIDLPDGGRPRALGHAAPDTGRQALADRSARLRHKRPPGRTGSFRTHHGHGSQPLALVPAGDGIYHGSAMLPVCVTGLMDWRATLSVSTRAAAWRLASIFRHRRRRDVS